MSKAKRKALSARTRFEVLKRDGFRCIYCGATPMDGPLEVDHVNPVAEGGGNEPENLASSCRNCNGGKGAVPLDRKALRPAVATDADREHIEQIREYLALQKQIQAERAKAAEWLLEAWDERIGPMTQKMADRLTVLAREWPGDLLIEAMEITANRMGTPGTEFNAYTATNQAKYFQGVLRNWRENPGRWR